MPLMWSKHDLHKANYRGHKFQAISQERVREIAARHLPKGWTAIETKWHNKLKCGAAYPDTKQITVPYLNDAMTVYIYLHECSHVHLGHFREPYLPLHIEEYQAERAALSLARIEGLRLPRSVTLAAKDYVRRCIEKDEKRGLKIDQRVRRWAGPKPAPSP
jgi:hypothetical protein